MHHIADMHNCLKVPKYQCFVKPVAGVLHQFPEEIRPQRPFDFVSVQCISAEHATTAELESIKNEMRRVLDWIHSNSEAEKEIELLRRLEAKQIDYGPSLV